MTMQYKEKYDDYVKKHVYENDVGLIKKTYLYQSIYLSYSKKYNKTAYIIIIILLFISMFNCISLNLYSPFTWLTILNYGILSLVITAALLLLCLFPAMIQSLYKNI